MICHPDHNVILTMVFDCICTMTLAPPTILCSYVCMWMHVHVYHSSTNIHAMWYIFFECCSCIHSITAAERHVLMIPIWAMTVEVWLELLVCMHMHTCLYSSMYVFSLVFIPRNYHKYVYNTWRNVVIMLCASSSSVSPQTPPSPHTMWQRWWREWNIVSLPKSWVFH